MGLTIIVMFIQNVEDDAGYRIILFLKGINLSILILTVMITIYNFIN